MKAEHIPNLITLLRFILMFPITWGLCHGHYQWAFYLFLVAGISDSFDGLLARHYGWISRLGTLIDPLADKCVILVILGVLARLDRLPHGLFLLVLLRDFWVMLGAIAYRGLIGPVEFSPLLTSKINTFFQLMLLTLLLFELAFSSLPHALMELFFYLIVLTTGLSGINYTWVWTVKAVKAWRVTHGS